MALLSEAQRVRREREREREINEIRDGLLVKRCECRDYRKRRRAARRQYLCQLRISDIYCLAQRMEDSLSPQRACPLQTLISKHATERIDYM